MSSSTITLLPEPAASRIVVVGDIILDEYLRGAVNRISPEAPVPVLASAATEQALGGAANVAANLQALGCEVPLGGVVGDDLAGGTLRRQLRATGLDDAGVVVVPARPTTHKLRVVSGAQHLLRIDREVTDPIPPSAQAALLTWLRREIPRARGVVCSDYRKGTLTSEFLAEVIALARDAGVDVLIDPKGRDYRTYAGAAVLTPNLHEVEQASGITIATPADLDRAVITLFAATGARALLVTCGKDGMVLYERGGAKERIAAEAREVFDVTGAGDTVIAAFALAYFAGAHWVDAARLANTAAGIAVGKLGTAAVSRAELLEAWDSRQGTGMVKIMSRQSAQAQCERARLQGRRIVFTNGCFDLLHAGHVQYLQAARAMGDLLVIGLNSDQSVRGLKGPNRPLVPEQERALLLSALACVDGVVLFDEPTPAALVAALRPDVLVKGADYRDKEVVGRDVVEAGGGRVELVPLSEGRSTSNLVQTILQRYAP